MNFNGDNKCLSPGKRCFMGNNLKLSIGERVKDVYSLCKGYVNRGGFLFAALDNSQVFDALIIRISKNSNGLLRIENSNKTLQEHIDLINQFALEKVKIIGNDFSFVKKCPTIKHCSILLDGMISDNLDFSPFYESPEIKTMIMLSSPEPSFENMKENEGLDCSRVRGLESLSVVGNSCYRYQNVKTLRRLSLFQVTIHDFSEFNLPNLKELSLTQCKLKSLHGIANFTSLQRLDLNYVRSLIDASEIKELQTLRCLNISSCPKVNGFNFIGVLKNLECLSLEGNNEIDDISFLNDLPKLRFLILLFNVLDGDLTLCKNIQYVVVKNRKHYNFKDKELPKNKSGLGFSIK